MPAALALLALSVRKSAPKTVCSWASRCPLPPRRSARPPVASLAAANCALSRWPVRPVYSWVSPWVRHARVCTRLGSPSPVGLCLHSSALTTSSTRLVSVELSHGAVSTPHAPRVVPSSVANCHVVLAPSPFLAQGSNASAFAVAAPLAALVNSTLAVSSEGVGTVFKAEHTRLGSCAVGLAQHL